MSDEPRYSAKPVNRDLYRVFRDEQLIGQLRLGLDKLWYPELIGQTSRSKATHTLLLADRAILKFTEEQARGHA